MTVPAETSTGQKIRSRARRTGGARVQSAFDSKLKGAFQTQDQRTISTHARISQAVQVCSKKYGVPQNLIRAVIKQESAFNPDATSHCGAQGLMQLMPRTAEDLGVKNAYNIEDNIRGGTKYLGQMLRMFKGNVRLALAAYNAGPGNVQKYGKIPPFKETQGYVRRIMRNFNRGQVNIPHNLPNASPGGTPQSKAETLIALNNAAKHTSQNLYKSLATAVLAEIAFTEAFTSNAINDNLTMDLLDHRSRVPESDTRPLPTRAIPV